MSRLIMHIDMNSYFASVEQQANPFLRGKPIGVTGKRTERSVVAAASIEAKRLGIKTAMSTWEAKRICPSIILVLGDPEKYSHITKAFFSIFKEFTNKVEMFSVDEGFLDVTDEAEDYLGAVIMAQEIKHRLKEACGEQITASIGIAPNKFMAKLASEYVKPDGLTVVKPEDINDFLNLVELQDFCGIGRRIHQRLNWMGIFTVRELQDCPTHKLIDEFKSYGWWLHEASFGIDHSPVSSSDEEPKSMGHSYTLPNDVTEASEIQRVLLGLAEKVGRRLRRDGFISREVSGYVRYHDFSGSGATHRFHEPTNDGLELTQIAWSQIKKKLIPKKAVRLVGISAGKLSKDINQSNLFVKSQKMKLVVSALDGARFRYGENAFTRASLLNVEFKARSSGFHYDHEI